MMKTRSLSRKSSGESFGKEHVVAGNASAERCDAPMSPNQMKLALHVGVVAQNAYRKSFLRSPAWHKMNSVRNA